MLKQDMSSIAISERVVKLIENDLETLKECDCCCIRTNLVEQLKRYKKAQKRVFKEIWCTRHYQVMSHQINKLDFLLNG